MTTRLSCAAKTDVGLKRSNNEDNLVLVPSHGLYVLADGMGGHASGQVASTMCVTHVAQFICETAKQPGFEFPYKPNPSLSYEANLLSNAIKFANERVFIQSCKDRSMEGMGTTVTAILNAPHGLVLAHVGDSRIYRVRHGQIVQMSRDHSLMNHLLDIGELKPEDAAGFANKNVILRAIGLKDYVDVEIHEVAREQGDIYMMCSDGLSDIVSDAKICQAINQAPNLQEACNALISLALQAGGKDNVTVVCVSVDVEDGLPSMSQPSVSRSVGVVPQPVKLQPPVSQSMTQPMKTMPSVQAVPVSSQPVLVPVTPAGMSGSNFARLAGYGVGSSPNSVSVSSMPSAGLSAKSPVKPVPAEPESTAQPSVPTRMHSVREIVERIPVQHAVMPKPIGSAGRSVSGSMPAAPAGGRLKTVRSESEHEAHHSGEYEAQEDVQMKPTVPMMPGTIENVVSEASSRESLLREVGALSKEDKAGLPTSGLLFMEPPSAPDADGSQNAGFDEDDGCRTMIECPIITDQLLERESGDKLETGVERGSNQNNGIYRVQSVIPSETQETRLFSKQDALRAARGEDCSELVEAALEEAPRPSEPVHKGYVAPREAIVPPTDDYDEDSIEIGAGRTVVDFDDDEDDDDVTRQFRRPSYDEFDKW